MPKTETYENGQLVATVDDRTLEEAKAERLAALADHRYKVEVGGITVGGSPVKTDRETQSTLKAARIDAKEDAGYTLNWKNSTGTFTTLNAPTTIAIADAAWAYVQGCFDNEAKHTASINALTTISAVDAYDITTGWPSQSVPLNFVPFVLGRRGVAEKDRLKELLEKQFTAAQVKTLTQLFNL